MCSKFWDKKTWQIETKNRIENIGVVKNKKLSDKKKVLSRVFFPSASKKKKYLS